MSNYDKQIMVYVFRLPQYQNEQGLKAILQDNNTNKPKRQFPYGYEAVVIK